MLSKSVHPFLLVVRSELKLRDPYFITTPSPICLILKLKMFLFKMLCCLFLPAKCHENYVNYTLHRTNIHTYHHSFIADLVLSILRPLFAPSIMVTLQWQTAFAMQRMFAPLSSQNFLVVLACSRFFDRIVCTVLRMTCVVMKFVFQCQYVKYEIYLKIKLFKKIIFQKSTKNSCVCVRVFSFFFISVYVLNTN